MGLLTTNYRCPQCGYDHEFDNDIIKKTTEEDLDFLPQCNDCFTVERLNGREIRKPVIMIKFDFKNTSQRWHWRDGFTLIELMIVIAILGIIISIAISAVLRYQELREPKNEELKDRIEIIETYCSIQDVKFSISDKREIWDQEKEELRELFLESWEDKCKVKKLTNKEESSKETIPVEKDDW